MTITAALVLYSVTWFMTFFVVLPLGTQSQDLSLIHISEPTRPY